MQPAIPCVTTQLVYFGLITRISSQNALCTMMRSPTQHLQYQVIPPHPLLTPYIGCYWILQTTAGQSAWRELTLPDGYAELILNYGKSYSWHDRERQIE